MYSAILTYILHGFRQSVKKLPRQHVMLAAVAFLRTIHCSIAIRRHTVQQGR
jgi:hypothetical protein